MNLPWWGWVLVALWCAPVVYCTLALMLQKPLPGLDENGKPYDSPSLTRRIFAFPLVFVVLVIVWPYVKWSEWRNSRQ